MLSTTRDFRSALTRRASAVGDIFESVEVFVVFALDSDTKMKDREYRLNSCRTQYVDALSLLVGSHQIMVNPEGFISRGMAVTYHHPGRKTLRRSQSLRQIMITSRRVLRSSVPPDLANAIPCCSDLPRKKDGTSCTNSAASISA